MQSSNLYDHIFLHLQLLAICTSTRPVAHTNQIAATSGAIRATSTEDATLQTAGLVTSVRILEDASWLRSATRSVGWAVGIRRALRIADRTDVSTRLVPM